MSSLTNVNIQSKTMNGLNTINADEITTDNFSATNLNATSLSVSGSSTLHATSTTTLTSTDITSSSLFVNGTSNRLKIQTDTAFKYWWYSNNGTLMNYVLNGNINYRGSINGNIETCGEITIYDGTVIPGVGNAPNPNVNKLFLGKSIIGYYNISTSAYNWSITSTGNLTLAGGITAPNLCYLNTTNNFTPAASTDAIQITKNGGGGYTYLNSGGNIGFWNGSLSTWNATPSGGLKLSDNFLPSWSSNTSDYINCYQIGFDVGKYQNTLSNNNIAFGDYSLYGGYNSNPLYTRASDNICMGHYTGFNFSDVNGDNSSSCNRNIILGNNAAEYGFVNIYDNVVIGHQCARSMPAFTQCVLIGSGVLKNNSAGQANSVVIGINNMINSGSNSGENTIVGYNNALLFGGNGLVCMGANNGAIATDNNRGMFIGSDSGTAHTTGTSCFYIGSQTGNNNSTGYNQIYIGNYLNSNSDSYYNTYAIGHYDYNIGQGCIQDNNEFVIAGCLTTTGWARLTLPNKNYLYCCQFPSTATLTLNYRSEDTVILTSTTTAIILPQSNTTYDYNIGAKFTFLKNYSTAISITLTVSSGQKILDNFGVAQTSITIPASVYYFRVHTIKNGYGTTPTTWAINYLKSNYLDTDTTQTITATKTFSTAPIMSGASIYSNSINQSSIIGMDPVVNNNNIAIGDITSGFATNNPGNITIMTSFLDTMTNSTKNVFIGDTMFATTYYTFQLYMKQITAIVTSTTTFTLNPVTPNIKAGMYMRSYRAGVVYTAKILSLVETTSVLTLDTACASFPNSYCYFYSVGPQTATYTPSVLMNNNTTFTITAGLNIAVGSTVSQVNPNGTTYSNTVVSYNGSTGVLVTSTAYTTAAGTTMYFYQNIGKGTNINYNHFNGYLTMPRVSCGIVGNVGIGSSVLGSNDTQNTNASTFSGSGNTGIGLQCGRNIHCNSNFNTFIGANSDLDVSSGLDPNNINYSTCIGASALCTGSNQIVLGTVNETTYIKGNLSLGTSSTSLSSSLYGGVIKPFYSNLGVITAATTLTVPFSKYYYVNAGATAFTITLPTITSVMQGIIEINFRRYTGTNTTVINAQAATGNFIIAYNVSSLSASGGTGVLLAANIMSVRLVCINGDTWAVM